ncbi:hypothetical protein HanRHA438_Chr15g0702471 [Helianthus annuus]|nr:hypothetical protein HanRHA438_Chr15g0702471 [Helianthus annuus]
MRYMFVSTQELWLSFFLMKITFFLALQIAQQVRSITKCTNLYSSVLLRIFIEPICIVRFYFVNKTLL